MTSDAVSATPEQTATIKAALEQRFPVPAADHMMQALFDAVLAWLIEQDDDHDRRGNSETD